LTLVKSASAIGSFNAPVRAGGPIYLAAFLDKYLNFDGFDHGIADAANIGLGKQRTRNAEAVRRYFARYRDPRRHSIGRSSRGTSAEPVP
jgi:hypothetical protein